MKARSVLLISGLLAAFLIQNACNKNANDPPDSIIQNRDRSLSIEEARDFYNRNYTQGSTRSTNLRQFRSSANSVYPLWRRANTWVTNKGNSYVEVPAAFSGKENFVVKTRLASEGDEKSFSTSSELGVQRMLFVKNKKGEIGQMLVNYIPDEEYVKQKNYDIGKNKLNELDKDYRGYIMYADIERTNSVMLRIEDGVTKKMYYISNSDKSSNVRRAPRDDVNAYAAMQCLEVCVERWQQLCTIISDPAPGQPSEECEDPVFLGESCTMVCYEFVDPPPPFDPSLYPVGAYGGYDGNNEWWNPYLPINFGGIKVNPTEENKCFNRSQGAKLTIFVQQPIEGSREKLGPNSVGHAFVGIEQNGTTRYMGFYPDDPNASLLGPQTAEIHDNSNELYHVSISKDLSASELTKVLDYMNNHPKSYFLNGYNCTNFAIEAAKEGNLILPRTIGEKSIGIFKFKGLNPGDLGEDLRNMTPPTGTTINKTKSNAPKKAGGC